jgi:2-amino-4-hydroxy-6-hydroxymethyldihydropteridine diphosphokinase
LALAAAALGANLEEPARQLREAAAILAQTPGLSLVKASQVYLTAPVGPAGQNWYHNQAILYRCELKPRELLRVLLNAETRMGRIRREHWGPRIIDLDLLFYGDLVLEEPDLTVPHPRLAERVFVLEPLNEIAPQWLHPVLGLTVAQLWAKIPLEERTSRRLPDAEKADSEL